MVRLIRLAEKRTGEILELNQATLRLSHLRKRVKAWCNAVDTTTYTLKMITLTYKPGCSWAPNHIRSFMLELRKLTKENLLAYCWVAELQERGAVHYHVLVALNKSQFLPVMETIWPYGMTRVQNAHKAGYVYKYAQKSGSKGNKFPAHCRMFAVWLSKQFVEGVKRKFKESMLPRWLLLVMADMQERNEDVSYFPSRSPGGGWLIGQKYIPSPYSLVEVLHQ